jgi:hypothetical protein
MPGVDALDIKNYRTVAGSECTAVFFNSSVGGPARPLSNFAYCIIDLKDCIIREYLPVTAVFPVFPSVEHAFVALKRLNNLNGVRALSVGGICGSFEAFHLAQARVKMTDKQRLNVGHWRKMSHNMVGILAKWIAGTSAGALKFRSFYGLGTPKNDKFVEGVDSVLWETLHDAKFKNPAMLACLMNTAPHTLLEFSKSAEYTKKEYWGGCIGKVGGPNEGLLIGENKMGRILQARRDAVVVP